MVVHRRILDAVIRHRIDLHHHANHQASVTIGLLSHEDTKLVAMLRARLPHLAAGDIGASRIKSLIASVRDLRMESFRNVRGELQTGLIELAKHEGVAIDRMVGSIVGAPVAFNPLRAGALREAVVGQPFAGGRNAARTLGQWFGKMAADDQHRLLGAVQLGVRNFEPVDTIVRRIAGTRKLGYSDGLLAISRREAEVAARTAVVHVANAAQVEWAQANSDVVTGLQWVAVLDDRACEECAAMDGQTTDDVPPAHPQCRCALVPLLDVDRLAGKVPDKVDEGAAEQEAA